MAFHKGRGILFGGVHDVEESEEGIDSEFFNQLFAWNTDRNRFFPLALRKPRAAGKKQAIAPASRRNRGKADEEELLRNLAELEAKTAGTTLSELDDPNLGPRQSDDEEEEKKALTPPKFEMPHIRFNAQLAVQDDTLFIFGGTFERGDQEFTFNDMYSIDLGKLDGVRELFFREPPNWNTVLEESEDEDDDDDEDDDFEGSDEEDAASTAPTETTAPIESVNPPAEEEIEPETEEPKDPRPSPRPFETLREFFTRTSTEWQNLLLEALKYKPLAESEKSVKEIRKEAFDMAEEKWWDAREEITALEDEQEEAGIGEVVSLADKSAGSGAGRRR